MKKRKNVVLIVIMAAVILVLVSWLWYSDWAENNDQTVISVIAYDNGNNDRWRTMDQGIRQACIELGIEKPVITHVRRTGTTQTSNILQREINNGAQGILIVSGTQEIVDCLSDTSLNLPIVLVENAFDESYPCVGADNAGMGKALADYMADLPYNITVLETGLEQRSVAERYQAFCSRMEELNKPARAIPYDAFSEDLKTVLAAAFVSHNPRSEMLAVLDNDSLEAAIDAVSADTTFCGIGSSDKVVHALDLGIIHGLVYQNEFASGYIGTMTLARRMGLAKPLEPMVVQYRLVTRESMYLEENERLLFPIIQ